MGLARSTRIFSLPQQSPHDLTRQALRWPFPTKDLSLVLSLRGHAELGRSRSSQGSNMNNGLASMFISEPSSPATVCHPHQHHQQRVFPLGTSRRLPLQFTLFSPPFTQEQMKLAPVFLSISMTFKHLKDILALQTQREGTTTVCFGSPVCF